MRVERVGRARSGRLGCGMVHGDGGGSAGHAGAGQGGHARKSLFYVYTCTHDLALVNELVEISGIFDEDDLVDVDQPESTLRTSRSRVSARQVSHSRAAWAGVRQGYCAHLICCMPIAAATEDHGMLRSLVVILRPLSPPDERKPWK